MTSSTAARRSVRTRRSTTNTNPGQKFVNFHWEGVNYTLDIDRSRVYRNWMAVETNKGFAILGAYRQTAALSA